MTLWWIGGCVAVVAALAHAVGGELLIIRRLQPDAMPASPVGDRELVKLYLRAVWHLATVDFALSACWLFAAARLGPDAAGVAAAKIVAAHFAGYVAVVLVAMVVSRRFDALWRVPQIYGLGAVALLAWLGIPGAGAGT